MRRIIIIKLTFAVLASLALALPVGASAQTITSHPIPRGPHGARMHLHGGRMHRRSADPLAVLRRLRHKQRAARRYAARGASTAHFNFPYGMAADGRGNVFVVNTSSNGVERINGSLGMSTVKLSTAPAEPISIAIDPQRNMFVGNENGGVQKYSAGGAYLQTITANADYPLGIAADQFDDLFITTRTGLAIDDSAGNSISSNVDSPGSQIDSVTIGGPNMYAFYDSLADIANGSAVLRGLGFSVSYGPLPTHTPLGSTCNAQSHCWITDPQDKLLNSADFANGTSRAALLPYVPAGAALDPIHNRLFVADPLENAVKVYDPSTLSLITTLS